jgi:signal peptidase II
VTPVTRNRGIALVLAAAVYVIDQWVKYLVTGPLDLRQIGDQIYVLPIFNLTLTHNYGVSLGFLEATSPEMRWGLVALTSVIALVVLVWMLRERKLLDVLPLGLILGGALGNIQDRAVHGFVIDYADLHFGEFRPFLIFNIADAAISIGVAFILVRALFMREKPDTPQEGKRADRTAENSTNA